MAHEAESMRLALKHASSLWVGHPKIPTLQSFVSDEPEDRTRCKSAPQSESAQTGLASAKLFTQQRFE